MKMGNAQITLTGVLLAALAVALPVAARAGVDVEMPRVPIVIGDQKKPEAASPTVKKKEQDEPPVQMVPSATVADLAKWNGQWPSRLKKGYKRLAKGQTFFDDPLVIKSIKGAVDDRVAGLLFGCWGKDCVEMPITRTSSVLVITVCRPHSCSSDAAYIHFSLKTGESRVCWREYSSKEKTSHDYLWDSKVVKQVEDGVCSGDEKAVAKSKAKRKAP